MSVKVPAFHPGEILAEFYMKPLGYTPGRLAKILGLDRQRIQRLVKGETSMTVDTTNRLGRAFSTTPQYWMDMQIAWDLQEFTKVSKKQHELDKIEPIDMENAVAA